MSYQVLARKWRPRRFADMVGQTHVLRALINALDHDRLHHAYLFTGTRGVGKTTIARIFAKSLNCEQGVSSSPCGECATCREIDEGRYVDLIEVDAASRTKVEDTRELLDNVQYAPTRGRCKVYLIDEVHMLSAHSFNALLKTLEEPPPHVKFLLATTDPQKLPATILSRCLQFNLKRLPAEQIADYLAQLLGHEAIEFEPPALQRLAHSADGSMRDALSLLDQAIAFGGGALREEDVCSMLGVIDQRYVYELLAAISANNGQVVLDTIARMDEQAPDYTAVVADMLSVLQRIAVAQIVPDSIDANAAGHDDILRLAGELGAEDVQLYYQIGLQGRRDLELAPDLRSGFEMLMLRLLAFRPVEAGQRPANQPQRGPSVPAGADVGQAVSAASATAPQAAPVTVEPPAAAAQLDPNEQDWHVIVEALGLSGLEKQLAINCALQRRDGDKFHLVLANEHSRLHNDKFTQRLLAALRNRFGEQAAIEISLGEHDIETPAMLDARRRDERQQQAEHAIAGDSNVQSLQEAFGATVVPDSVQPVD
ncbi:MAG: DNA polymerase III subunit gamma/tau [Granulosicoccaceae bacterium]|jgi:DNA polymerase-3 subunit gamma/tau